MSIFDRWQLDDLMGVVRFKRDEVAVAAGTGAGLNQVHFGGTEQLGALASVALLPAAFARGWPLVALGVVAGGIG